MDIKQKFTDKLNKLILHWTTQGIKLNSGITIDNLKILEADFGFSFEEDFHIYLTKVDGFVDFDFDEAWSSFWSQNRMREENEDGLHPEDIFGSKTIQLISVLLAFIKLTEKYILIIRQLEV